MTLLHARDISKRYGATVALDGVDFSVHAGAVNVLIGENGAGKSTLMRIIAGVEQCSAGQLLLNGEPLELGSVRAAARHGIGIVFQELNLCPNLSVSENIFLGRPIVKGAIIDHVAERKRAADLLARLGTDIDPNTPVGMLRIGQKQIVEIARALAEDARILIMDEPTSALSATEVEVLFRIMGELRDANVGIIYISHRLEELIRIGDYVTVLRDGRLVANAPIADVSIPWIVKRMLGETESIERKPRLTNPSETTLSVRDATLRRPDGLFLVDHVTADFCAGEITAIYGLLGAGRTELFELICGIRIGEGSIQLNGEELSGLTLPDRVERRLLLVPEDRQNDGLFPNLDVGGNLGLAFLRKLARFGLISPASEESAVNAMIRRSGIKARSGSTRIAALSGGNQQKVMIGRNLMPGPVAILLDEPSRGIDVGARAEVFGTMRAMADDGIAVIFATSDITEAQIVADRILVMATGRITADIKAEQADEETLVRAANKTLVAID